MSRGPTASEGLQTDAFLYTSCPWRLRGELSTTRVKLHTCVTLKWLFRYYPEEELNVRIFQGNYHRVELQQCMWHSPPANTDFSSLADFIRAVHSTDLAKFLPCNND